MANYIIENEKRHILFKDLKPGDIFFSANCEKLYIKTVSTVDNTFNAVDLETGHKEICFQESYVQKYVGDLILNNNFIVQYTAPIVR